MSIVENHFQGQFINKKNISSNLTKNSSLKISFLITNNKP
jgi:hypothetical protein